LTRSCLATGLVIGQLQAARHFANILNVISITQYRIYEHLVSLQIKGFNE